jgi:hypothetical protein
MLCNVMYICIVPPYGSRRGGACVSAETYKHEELSKQIITYGVSLDRPA